MHYVKRFSQNQQNSNTRFHDNVVLDVQLKILYRKTAKTVCVPTIIIQYVTPLNCQRPLVGCSFAPTRTDDAWCRARYSSLLVSILLTIGIVTSTIGLNTPHHWHQYSSPLFLILLNIGHDTPHYWSQYS